jgi:Ca-activated chloride channel homolog
VPLTTDHAVLVNLLREVEIGMIEDGTAIGMGIATAVNRLRNSESKSRIIILLTDGVNNRGAIDPLTAADIAASLSGSGYIRWGWAAGEQPRSRSGPPMECNTRILRPILTRRP